jgi:CheY-like chemotaxis protein
MSRRAGWRRSSKPLEIREPDVDQRLDRILQPGLARDGERLLVALARFAMIHPLLEPVVAGHKQLLDPRPSVDLLHERSLAAHISVTDKTNMEAATNIDAPIRVLIADDHRLFAEALDAILSGESRIDVVGRARNGAEALELALDLDPDVVLMDISMPVMDGLEATRRIREARPQARVLMLTGSNAAVDVDRSRTAGAAGYVTKDRIASQLVDAIVEAASH